MQLEPVEIRVEQSCRFKKKPRHPETGRKQLGCARCGAAKNDPSHFGAPPSLNSLGSGNPRLFQWFKRDWEAVLGAKLAESALPHGLERVVVEGVVCFPDRRDRDEGNHRFLLEKALGDVLQARGYLPSDDWEHFRFGALERVHEPGVSWTRLMLFPTAHSAASAA